MDCDALHIAFVILVKSPRLPASGANQDGLHLRDADLGFPPSQQRRRHGLLRGAGRGARGWAALGISRETRQQMACLPAPPPGCGAAGGEAISGKSMFSRVRLVIFFPLSSTFYFSSTSFITGNEVSVFIAGTLSEGSQVINQC